MSEPFVIYRAGPEDVKKIATSINEPHHHDFE